MKLFDLSYIKETLESIDLDTGSYYDNDNIHITRELINFIFTFPSISRLIVMMYHKRRSSDEVGSLERRLYKVIEATNVLAATYLKHIQKRYSIGKPYYNRPEVSELKKALKSLDDEILLKLNVTKHGDDFLPAAFTKIVHELRDSLAKRVIK